MKLLILIIILALIPMVWGAAGGTPGSNTVVQVSPSTVALQVVFPKNDYFKLNDSIEFHIHLFNSTGQPFNSSQGNCTIHLYGPEGQHILNKSMGQDGQDFETIINATLINHTGSYPYLVYCNSTEWAGYTSSNFYVTNDGLPPLTSVTNGIDLGTISLLIILTFLVVAAVTQIPGLMIAGGLAGCVYALTLVGSVWWLALVLAFFSVITAYGGTTRL